MWFGDLNSAQIFHWLSQQSDYNCPITRKGVYRPIRFEEIAIFIYFVGVNVAGVPLVIPGYHQTIIHWKYWELFLLADLSCSRLPFSGLYSGECVKLANQNTDPDSSMLDINIAIFAINFHSCNPLNRQVHSVRQHICGPLFGIAHASRAGYCEDTLWRQHCWRLHVSWLARLYARATFVADNKKNVSENVQKHFSCPRGAQKCAAFRHA